MEDAPLRLLVSAIVVGLTLPAIASALSDFEAQHVALQVERELDRIVRVAQSFYIAGGGGTTVHVDLGGGIGSRLEYLDVGDAPGGPRAPSAVFKLTGHPAVFVLSDPRVPMTGGGGPLHVEAGTRAIRISYEGEGPVRLAVG